MKIDWNNLLTYKKFIDLTRGKTVIESVEAWKQFVEENFVLKREDDILRKKAMEALKCVVEDIEMLQDGRWSEITDENCEATLDNLVIIMNYLESQMKK